MPAYPTRDGAGGTAKMSQSHTHSPQPQCVKLHGSFVFILPYVFRLHGFFVLSKLNTQAIIHDASSEPVQQRGGWWAGEQ